MEGKAERAGALVSAACLSEACVDSVGGLAHSYARMVGSSDGRTPHRHRRRWACPHMPGPKASSTLSHVFACRACCCRRRCRGLRYYDIPERDRTNW